MDRQDRGHLRKRVDFVAKDADEQVATGVVMVPDAVDLQGDYVTEDTIREFAGQFGNLVDAGEASGGIMHAAWPSEWMDLEDNRVLDEPETIGGTEVAAGSWVQSWRFNDDALWNLVDDGVLGGYSIGAVDVEWRGPMEQDDLPEEVSVPEEFDEDELVWELISGIIREVSAVDIPAVPDAQILDTKDAYLKRLADHLGNRDGFIEEAIQRGHDEADAERLWDLLNRAIDQAGSGDPASGSMLARAGKAFLNTLTGTDDATPDGGRSHSDAEASVGKEGRTLSAQNRDDLKAVIDAAASIMEDAGEDHGIQRFTDREEDTFDLTEHSARAFDTPDEDEEEEEETTEDSAATDDTMTDDKDTDPWDDAPEWAKSLRADVESHGETIAELTDTDDGGDDDPFADAPEWAHELKDAVESNSAAIETIGKQSGLSDQLDGGDEGGDPPDEVEAFKAGLMGQTPVEGD